MLSLKINDLKNLPIAAWLTVNRQCNFRCKWCYAQDTDFDINKNMSISMARDIVNIVKGVGIKYLIITGGEPTLWKPLQKLNMYCSELGMTTTIITNTMQFGNDQYWKEYIQNPSDRVNISLKAGTPETLFHTTGVSNSELVEKGIRRAIQHYKTGVSITYNTYCSDKLLELAEFAMRCGANMFNIDFCSPVFIDGEPTNKWMIEPNQIVNKIIRDYDELDKITQGKITFMMTIPFCLWPKGFIEKLLRKNQITSVCQLIKREGIVIECDGTLSICNGLFDFPIGKYQTDYHDSQSLIELLNSREVNNYYQEITRYPSNICSECVWYSMCGGGCPLRWTIYDPNQLLPREEVNV